MNWFEIINKATLYIEDNIASNLSSKDIAKHCNVSYYYFTKTFSLVTGYNLVEYIRNRRITLASYDISNTDTKIIDIAIKYGYSSNEAFSRAFKKIHGINPSTARKNHITVFTHFPVLQYDIPKPNILSLRYDIMTNIDYKFIGLSTYIVEEDYNETQTYQQAFVDDFKKQYPSNSLLYRVHHNVSYDDMKYDYLVGYSRNDFQHKSLNTLHIKASKAIRFIANSITLDVIPNLKKIIYDEWQKNEFIADGNCEIEYVIKKDENLFDFYYIVSII